MDDRGSHTGGPGKGAGRNYSAAVSPTRDRGEEAGSTPAEEVRSLSAGGEAKEYEDGDARSQGRTDPLPWERP